MSSLPPVTSAGNGNVRTAIDAALKSSLVLDALKTLTTFRSDNFGVDGSDPTNYVTEQTYNTPGFVGNISVGMHNLVLTDAHSIVNISAGDRTGYLDTRAVVVVGGDSKATFTNSPTSPSFGYDIVSGAGNNTITLNNGPTLFQSTTGNDLVKSGGGLDTIMGGSGHDTIYAGGQSFVQAGSAGDKIFSSTLSGGSDTIQAGAGADTIMLQSGNNSVIGSSGNTIVQGGAGNDTFDGASATGNESILGGTGNLTANVSAQGNDTIFGQAGHDVSVNINEASSGSSSTTDATSGVTTIHFTGGQTIEVKSVNITFNDGTKAHY